MKWKNDTDEWKRVFVFWPKHTLDGFKVSFDHVWKKVYFSEEGALAPYKVVEYHTNPNGLEDEYQKKHDTITQIQIGGNNSQCIQSDGDLYINGKKYEGSGHVLTEGKTLHHPKRPSKREVWDKIQSPKRPPPPPAPPPIRRISEDISFDEIFEFIDKKVDKIVNKDAHDRVEKNKEILKTLKKRKNRRDAKDIVEKWPKWKKDFRLTKYSDW